MWQLIFQSVATTKNKNDYGKQTQFARKENTSQKMLSQELVTALFFFERDTFYVKIVTGQTVFSHVRAALGQRFDRHRSTVDHRLNGRIGESAQRGGSTFWIIYRFISAFKMLLVFTSLAVRSLFRFDYDDGYAIFSFLLFRQLCCTDLCVNVVIIDSLVFMLIGYVNKDNSR